MKILIITLGIFLILFGIKIIFRKLKKIGISLIILGIMVTTGGLSPTQKIGSEIIKEMIKK